MMGVWVAGEMGRGRKAGIGQHTYLNLTKAFAHMVVDYLKAQ